MYQIFGETCCGQRQPYGLDKTPVFSWKLKSNGKNVVQQAYEIDVKDAEGNLIWNSGLVSGTKVHHILYEGPQLESLKEYFWKVKSISNKGETAIGNIQSFMTGILDCNLWKAKWIEPDIERKPCQDEENPMKFMSGQVPYYENPEEVLNPCVYFRKKVTLNAPVKKAIALATAHGVYELYMNGQPYGHPLAPGYTVYREYQEYQCYDITKHLHEGENVIGAIVADGWYLGKIGLPGIGNQYGEQLAFFAQLVITYEDGTEEIICTDEEFKVSTGAYLYSDLMIGEGYDASKEPEGWMEADFDAKEWKGVFVKSYGCEHLHGAADEQVTFVRIQRPKEVLISPKGELIVNAGENIAGFISIKGNVKKGDRVKLEYCEVLDKDGNFLRNIIGQNKNQTDVYISGEDGAFYYCPKFTFHGFQYVRVSGLSDVKPEDIEVYVLASGLKKTGEFECSNEKLNQLQENIFRSQQGNMCYIPTDCPQREKAGWTGDMQAYAPTAMYLMDMEAFLRKWLANMRIEQEADGSVPAIIPAIPSTKKVMEKSSSSGWADACVIIPYRLYKTYGDKSILEENFDMMMRWMAYVENVAATELPDWIENPTSEQLEHQKYLWNTGFHYGDWLIPSLSKNGVADPFYGANMTKELVAPAMYAYTTKLMEEICMVLGKEEEADRFSTINKKIKEAYTHEYLIADGILKVNYQGIYVLALKMNLVPEDQREKLLEHLIQLIRENNGCLDTGFLSMPFLLDVLYENGKPEEAFKLLYQEKCPSWLYEVNQGANTIWESWTNIAENGERNNSSYNHFSFGCVGDFMYRHILGIEGKTAGYEEVLIKPDLTCGVDYAKGSFESVYGDIKVSWSNVENAAVLDVEIPPCVTAQIEFGKVSETVGSGSYHFVTTQ